MRDGTREKGKAPGRERKGEGVVMTNNMAGGEEELERARKICTVYLFCTFWMMVRLVTL